MKYLLCLAIALAFSCQNTAQRNPSSVKDLNHLFSEIEATAQNGVGGSEQCRQEAQKFYETLYQLESSNVDFDSYSAAELKKFAEISFQARINIKKHLAAFEPEAEGANECFSAVRDITRALRYFEDYLVEAYEAGQSKEYSALSGEGLYFLKNDKFVFRNHQDLRSGDVILSRGNAYTSAAIARIGASDAQFSHLSFVYKSPEGDLFTTEAHIEIGSIVEPLSSHLEQGNAREVVLRFKDEKVAHLAAKYAYERVKKHREETGFNIQYDFSMNHKDSKRLFCTEVAYEGFAESGLDVPGAKMKFSAGLIPFLQRIGIPINEKNVGEFETFAPGDLEFDPRFDIVAEWRNPNLLLKSRMKDAALTKMFEWMEKEGYRFRPSVVMNLKSYSAWLLRRTPLIKRKLQDKFPLNMSPGILNTFLVLDDVAETLYLELERAHEEAGQPLSFKEMFAVLEEFKERDKAKRRRSSDFHNRFRP